MNPNVQLARFEEYGGGYGLLANPVKDDGVVNYYDTLFEIPKHLITSRDSILSNERYGKDTTAYKELQKMLRMAVNDYDEMFMDDVIISMQLMVECSLGDESFLKPYLDMLPTDAVPRYVLK